MDESQPAVSRRIGGQNLPAAGGRARTDDPVRELRNLVARAETAVNAAVEAVLAAAPQLTRTQLDRLRRDVEQIEWAAARARTGLADAERQREDAEHEAITDQIRNLHPGGTI